MKKIVKRKNKRLIVEINFRRCNVNEKIEELRMKCCVSNHSDSNVIQMNR